VTDDRPIKDDPRTVFGWCMYDWASSAYVTTVAVGLLPRYFADVVVPPGGIVIGGTTVAADTLWAIIVGAATLIAFVTSPVLGAVADFSSAKKRFLLTFAWIGNLFTVLLYFCRAGDVVTTLLFFLVAQVGFIAANVFYDAFLPHIASPGRMDWISGKGYSYGYVGGGLQFALALLLVSRHEAFGLSLDEAVRLGIVMAGLWWAGFTLFTAFGLREPAAAAGPSIPERFRRWPRLLVFAAVGVVRTWHTTKKVRQFAALPVPGRLHALRRRHPDGDQHGGDLRHRGAEALGHEPDADASSDPGHRDLRGPPVRPPGRADRRQAHGHADARAVVGGRDLRLFHPDGDAVLRSSVVSQK